LEFGTGIGKNAAEAVKYYKLSADQGNASGRLRYGLCLEKGRGIGKNAAEAVKYYKLSADQGNAYGKAAYARCRGDSFSGPTKT
jgi:TPR repeat protein